MCHKCNQPREHETTIWIDRAAPNSSPVRLPLSKVLDYLRFQACNEKAVEINVADLLAVIDSAIADAAPRPWYPLPDYQPIINWPPQIICGTGALSTQYQDKGCGAHAP